jgi:uncharacterized protein (TIGR01777 family)
LKAREKIEHMPVQMSESSSGVVEPLKKIVVSGASGMLGTALREKLATQNRSVLQLVRSTGHAPGRLAWDPATLPPLADARALEGCAGAIHLSGANLAGRRWTSAYRREIAATRVKSTRALATVLAELRRPPRTLVVASAVGVYGDRGEEVVDESSEPGEGFLADTCQQWEAAAKPAVEAGIRVVHARFGVVLGPGPGALEKMVPLFRLGLGGRLGSGRQWMSWVSVGDAVAALLFALENETLAGAVNLTAPEPVTNAEFTKALGRTVHRPAILPVPAFALRIALGPMADEALLASTRAVPTRLMAAGFVFQHPILDAALAAAIN